MWELQKLFLGVVNSKSENLVRILFMQVEPNIKQTKQIKN